MQNLNHETILLAVVVVIGLAVLLQAIMLLAILVAVRKAATAIREETEKLRSSVMPVIYDTRDMLASTQGVLASTQDFLATAQGFVNRVAPKIEAATADLAGIAHGLRIQAAELETSAQEMMEQVRRQGDRLDNMFSNVLDTADRAGGFVVDVVSKPVQQVSGILRSVKAIIESLRGHQTLR